jgi:hypothetical protein
MMVTASAREQKAMGLYVHSIGEIPQGAARAYYVYLLDYGWKESLGDAVRQNLPKMMDLASRSNAVVIHGPRGVHFEDEVLSWHHINGQDAQDILLAILVSTRHPSTFQESFVPKRSHSTEDALLLIPLRKLCTSAEQVVELVRKVFADIKHGKRLKDFAVAKRMRRGVGHAVVDAVILQPNLGGIGVDVKKLFGDKR